MGFFSGLFSWLSDFFSDDNSGSQNLNNNFNNNFGFNYNRGFPGIVFDDCDDTGENYENDNGFSGFRNFQNKKYSSIGTESSDMASAFNKEYDDYYSELHDDAFSGDTGAQDEMEDEFGDGWEGEF